MMNDHNATKPSVWADLLALAKEFPNYRPVALIIMLVGLAGALAEILSVGLAVLLLFSLLDQGTRIAETGGFLSAIYIRVEASAGAQPMVIAIVIVGMILATALLSYVNNALTGLMLNRVAERMRDLVHDRYVRIAYTYLQKRDQGALLHTLSDETWSVAEAFGSLARLTVNLTAALAFGAAMFLISWKLGLTALIGALVALLILRLISRPVRRLGAELLAEASTLADRMLISLRGMRTLRVFALEPQIEQAFDEASARVSRKAIKMELFKSAIGPLNHMFGLGILVLIVGVAAVMNIDAATAITVALLLFRLQPFLHQFEQNRVQLAGAAASLSNVRGAINVSDKPWPIIGHFEFGQLAQGIEFHDVSFAHAPARAPTVSDLSFWIPAGRTTALIGPSGSGKSTIINLLLRLYEPDSGHISVDGRSLLEFSRPTWLHKVAVAGQDIELLEGTVLDNLRVGSPDAGIHDIEAACAAVEILEELERLPAGLETPIGAQGLSFSGGQRQRIGLARALIRDPDILLLDEAMSALEPEREMRIFEHIRSLHPPRTVIIVSHRPNVRDIADLVVEIREGKLVNSDRKQVA